MGGFHDGAEDPVRRPNRLPNIDVMTGLIKETGEDAFTQARLENGSPVVVRGDSTADAWIAYSAFVQTFKAHQCPVFRAADTLSSPKYLFEYHLIGLGVRYENLFRSGLFGPKFLTRAVTTNLAYQLTDTKRGEVLTSRQETKKSVDTVAVDDIPGLENPTLRSTLGVVPSDSFIDRAVEPFIILGAAGVAIYLLFHIRSS